MERKLKSFSDSQLGGKVRPELLACCPTINLSVSVSEDDVLYIRRGGGDIVSKHSERGKKVLALRWKADGQFLAVGWSDGVVRLMGLENSKALHHLRVSEPEVSSGLMYIGWSRNLTGKQSLGPKKRDATAWGRSLLDGVDAQEKEHLLELPDLPHELTFLEVDTSLPKLSPLPVSGGAGDDMYVFSTRTSLEFVFQPLKAEDNDTVDVMLVSTGDGGLQLSIYDTFVIGTFKVEPSLTPRAASDGPPLHLRRHASHPAISTYSLLFSPPEPDAHAMYLVPMDLTFIYSSPVNLSLLASKTTTLQKLLRYVKQTQIHMAGEWQAARELPGKLMLSVQEDLQSLQGGPKDIVDALYHTVVTGHTIPVVKEWLVDTLAERGHKRWDKATTAGLENLRDLVHQNMIPALERCGVILSRLLGLARFHDGNGVDIGFTSPQITRLTDIVSCLALVSNKILLFAMEELELFAVFSSWLRFEIDRLASSTESEELSEKEATTDNGKVLTYIQRYLTKSPLGVYFDKATKEDWTRDWDHIDDGPSLLDILDKQLQKHELGVPHMKAFPQLDFLVDYLSRRASSVFKDIAEAEKRSVRFGQRVQLDIGSPIAQCDAQVCPISKTDGLDGVTFTALTSQKKPTELYLFRTEMAIINGISSKSHTTACGLALPDGAIAAIAFLSAQILLVLWTAEGGAAPARLLAVPVQSPALEYAAYAAAAGVPPPMARPRRQALLGTFWSAAVPEDWGFAPVCIEVVAPSAARGEMPGRVCMLGADRSLYRVFELPKEMEMMGK